MENHTDNHNLKISKEEAVRKIEEVYHAHYDPDSELDLYDQLSICESLAESNSINNNKENIPNENINLNGNDNGTNKHKENLKQTSIKLELIRKLKTCNYRTPPKIIATLLEQLLNLPDTKQGHWLFIAQKYTPKTINSVINKMIKAHSSGSRTITKPAAYFTCLIKHHKSRRNWLSDTNGIGKQQKKETSYGKQ